MKSNNISIYLTFVLLGLAIWIDSLWIKIPMSLYIAFTWWSMVKENK